MGLCFLHRLRGENRSVRRKTSRSKGENQQQSQPKYGVDAEIWNRAPCHNWWEENALAIAPALLPKFGEVRHMEGDFPVDLAQTAQS